MYCAHWDKILLNLKKKAKQLKNDHMKTIVKHITDVDPGVKEYILKALLERN